jgi:hypothetical protein
MNFWFQNADGRVHDWDSDKTIGKCLVVGMTNKTDPITGHVHEAEVVQVSLDDGQIVNCTRLGPEFVLVPIADQTGRFLALKH